MAILAGLIIINMVDSTKEANRVAFMKELKTVDILMIDDIVSNEEHLILPHPKMHQREFVLKPLCEIAPNVVHPTLKVRIKEIKTE